jgi:hypothetical protein
MPQGAGGRRGRKPRGGKIVQASARTQSPSLVPHAVVLRFLCTVAEARNDGGGAPVDVAHSAGAGEECAQVSDAGASAESGGTPGAVWEKVRALNDSLHHVSSLGTSADCFWCTCAFATPPVFIPEDVRCGVVHVYGSFCSPECAAAYLFKEDIDVAQRWERYSLLNLVYGGLFGHEKNIKPAPPPFYLLDKFYGSLAIEEYRALLASDKRLIVVDRPMVRSVPYLFDDNDELSGSRMAAPTKRSIVESAFGGAFAAQ